VVEASSMEQNVKVLILNYVFWFLILTVTQGLGWEISNEAGIGTLEQLYLSPYNLWFLLLTRMISTIFINICSITLLLFAAMFTSKQWLNLDLISIIPILTITLIGVLGVGYAVAGITIIFKQVGVMLQLFQFLIMGLTFIPLTLAPFLKFGPFMLGLQMIRDIAINNKSIDEFQMTDIIFLILNACIYFIIGCIVFIKCEEIARRMGLFGHY